ncbi:diacylglycerol/lipid kinase family protein [Aestuariivivens sediminis]|uniref:diacylglycerol/lipid kinase family protein n=1 Tax=Aestuariivivens sediminis TaxID=2913557 RepID=UPI001F578250|nr:YegS/Rv2252/BmrU family lipid kinase [Aestuariivivens sediminis]
MKRILFIVNGAKKQSKKLRTILAFFSNHTFFSKVEVVITRYSGHATIITKENVSTFDYIIAVGGDGTLNEVINGIDLSSKVITGLLPYGTGNDFSRGQELQFDAHFLFNLIKNDSYKSIDLGLVKGLDKKTVLTKRFVNIADIGLGGFVTQAILKQNTRFISGKVKYALAILRGMIQYSKPELKVDGDYMFNGKILTLAICNGPYFGYGLCIAPKANIHSNTLNITSIGNVSLLDYFKNLGRIKRGEMIKHPEVHYDTVRSIDVYHNDRPCPIEIDGEFIGYTPVRIQILPQKLKFLLPLN